MTTICAIRIENLPAEEYHRLIEAPDRAGSLGWGFVVSLTRSCTTLVALNTDGLIVGYLTHNGAYITAVEVLGSYRAQGIGRQLVAHLQAIHPTLEAGGVQPRAFAFWQALGFVEGDFDDDGSWFWKRQRGE
jgi:ribosomal protein S18 acetylase RimI-like enzyme